MRRRDLWTWTLVLAGCAGSSAPAAPPEEPPHAEPSDPGCNNQVQDAFDVCTYLPHRCPSFEDVDGCPELVIALGAECSPGENTRRELDEVAGELIEDQRLTLLVLHGEQRCSDWVKSELVRRGVNAERLTTKVPETIEANMVYPEVTVYDGKECP